jgi:hypothetical protein
MEKISSKFGGDKSKESSESSKLNQLRHEHRLPASSQQIEKRPPNLLTREGMVYSQAFQNRLDKRKEATLRFFSSEFKETIVNEAYYDALARCDKLRNYQVSSDQEAEFFRNRIKEVEEELLFCKENTDKDYLAKNYPLEKKQIREQMCKDFAVHLGRLDILEWRLQNSGGLKAEDRLDPKSLEEAFRQIEQFTLTDATTICRSHAAISDTIYESKYTIQLVIDDPSLLKEKREKIVQDHQSLFSAWNKMTSWVKDMMYPWQQGRKTYTDQGVQDMMMHFVQTSKDILALEQRVVRSLDQRFFSDEQHPDNPFRDPDNYRSQSEDLRS